MAAKKNAYRYIHMQKPQNDLSGQEHFQVQRLDVKKKITSSFIHAYATAENLKIDNSYRDEDSPAFYFSMHMLLMS